MSSTIWTPDALSSEVGAYAGLAWRVVEAQHAVATLPLVDTLDEQALLEELLESTKPRIPRECAHLQYLLATPFRYGAPYPKGSRFRRAGRTLGVFHASEAPETALAEMAFHRLLFYAEAPAAPWPGRTTDLTAFSVEISTNVALDLTHPPLSRDAALWTDPVDYTACQSLADAARAAGVEAIRYASVRDPAGRANLAVLSCGAFAAPEPAEHRTWWFRVGTFGVQALCERPRVALEFRRDSLADPRLAGMVWDRPVTA
jgi:hypothetical protein